MIILWYPLFAYLKERMIGAMRQGIDIHAHILPGVDDGAADWAEAEAMLQEAERQGIRCIIATPHYRPGQNRDVLAGMAEKLTQMARKIRPDMLVCLGQEVLYFEGLEKALRKGEVLPLAGSRYVLVEFAPSDPWRKLERAVRQLIQAGYIPVIAHWERYGCLYEQGRLEELIRTGALIQMNYHSLEGSLFKGMTNRRLRWRRRMVLRETFISCPQICTAWISALPGPELPSDGWPAMTKSGFSGVLPGSMRGISWRKADFRLNKEKETST